MKGSPAESAGIKAGDIILKFNGEAVNGAAHLKNMVGREKPGASSKLTIFRNNKSMDMTVKIAERTPKAVAAAKGTSETQTSNELGVELEKVPPAVAEKMGLKDGEGVRIKDVNSDGVGSRMDLRPGDVILEVDGKTVSEISDFNSAVETAKKNKVIRLKVQRGNNKIYLASNLG